MAILLLSSARDGSSSSVVRERRFRSSVCRSRHSFLAAVRAAVPLLGNVAGFAMLTFFYLRTSKN